MSDSHRRPRRGEPAPDRSTSEVDDWLHATGATVVGVVVILLAVWLLTGIFGWV